MSRGSSGGTTTVTQANREPWGPSQPFLNDNLQRAHEFYNLDGSPGKQIYQGTTVIPFSQRSTQGMNFMEGVANNAMDPMQNTLTAFSGQMKALDPIARGDFTNDTTFNANLGRMQQDAARGVNLAMSGAGRYGSGQHTDRLASTIGDVTNRAMLDRQQFATNALQNYGNAMPSALAGALAPGQTLMGLGQMDENLAANYAQEQRDKFYAPIDRQRQNILEQNAIFSGVGQLGQSGTGSTTETVRTPGNAALGYALPTAGRIMGGKG